MFSNFLPPFHFKSFCIILCWAVPCRVGRCVGKCVGKCIGKCIGPLWSRATSKSNKSSWIAGCVFPMGSFVNPKWGSILIESALCGDFLSSHWPPRPPLSAWQITDSNSSQHTYTTHTSSPTSSSLSSCSLVFIFSHSLSPLSIVRVYRTEPVHLAKLPGICQPTNTRAQTQTQAQAQAQTRPKG